MNPFSTIWNGLIDLLQSGLSGLHGVFEPIFGAHAWGWAIIALTIVIRILLLPLALKQTRSMRAMQALGPQVKAIQKKYKVDRELMRRDPAAYRERKAKMNEEVMALYKAHGANPAAGCLPLLLQAPVFIALFRVLQANDNLTDAPFYVFTRLVNAVGVDFTFFGVPLRTEVGPHGLGGSAQSGGIWGWVLILAMAGTMFETQRQMIKSQPQTGEQAQQQKILMYVMPLFLVVIARNLPIGVLLYWVTTNLWLMGQQAVIMREVRAHPGAPPATPTKSTKAGAAGAQKPQKQSQRPQGNNKQQKQTQKQPQKQPQKAQGSTTSGRPSGGNGARSSGGTNRSSGSGRSTHLPSRPSSGGTPKGPR